MKSPLKLKLTPTDIHSAIKHEFYLTGDVAIRNGDYVGLGIDLPDDEEALSRFTICLVVLHNGFIACGTNACVSKETWSAEIGKSRALDAALETVWLVMGYALKDQLHTAQLEGASNDPATAK